MSTQNLNTIICTNLEEFEQHIESFEQKIENLFVVRIPDGVTHIPDGAFKNGHLIKEVILPASLETIGNEAFMNCDKLETVTCLGNNLTEIGDSAFFRCTSLETVTCLGNNLTSIGYCAFYGCISLETVTFLGNNLTEIGQCAFHTCTSLQHIDIPNSVTSIRLHAFYGCTSLHVPTLRDYVRVGRNAFKECIRPDIFAASSKPPLKMQHDDICSICHESDWNNAVLLNCGHIFHKTCAQTWFTRKENCSNCRAPTTSCNHIIGGSPTDFNFLLGGSPITTMDEIKRRTHITGGGGGASTQIISTWFWSVVESMTQRQRSKLLYFSTGSTRLPAGTSRALNVEIVSSLSAASLPSATTCSKKLQLPAYNSLVQLQQKLLLAIEDCTTYELQ